MVCFAYRTLPAYMNTLQIERNCVRVKDRAGAEEAENNRYHAPYLAYCRGFGEAATRK
jgi:hypothetical protein